MKKRKKLIMAAAAGLVVLASFFLFVMPALAAVNVGSRNTTHFFDYNGGSGWADLKTPEHFIVGTSPEQVAYCLQHRSDSPSNSPYNETDILGSYSARVQTGLRIIFKNGYPYATGGLSAAAARYATANAVRFWLSENGDSGQYNFTNLGSYTDAQLRTAAANGVIGSKIRANSGYTNVLQFSIELLIKARSQALMAHDISLSTPAMAVSGNYFTGTSTVTLTNMNGGYTLDTSGLPSGSSVTGYTGNSGDVLTIRVPLSEANANRSFNITATGRDNRTRSNMFAYAPNNSSLQRVMVAKPAVYNEAKTVTRSISTPQIYADLVVSALSADYAERMRECLWERNIPMTLTSGTLAVGADFSRFREQTGLNGMDARLAESVSASPFDYTRNCRMYFPRRMHRKPEDGMSYIGEIAEQITGLVRATHGHTLALFNAYTVMSAVCAQVKRMDTGFPLFILARNQPKILDAFRKSGNGVLFATGSVWEGMDFPGDMVSSLIIARLPFAVPDALSGYEKKKHPDLKTFIQKVAVPDMQIKLRQGFGRAIRTETDTCVISILDERSLPGRRFHMAALAALPDMPVTDSMDDVAAFIRAVKPKGYFLGGREND